MLVVCYCITNDSKTWYKMTPFMILQSLWVQTERGSAVFSGSRSSTKLLSLRSSSRKDLFPYLLSDCWRFQFLTRLLPQGLNCARAAGHKQTCSSLPSGPLHKASQTMVPCFIRASKGVGNSMIVRWMSQSFGI